MFPPTRFKDVIPAGRKKTAAAAGSKPPRTRIRKPGLRVRWELCVSGSPSAPEDGRRLPGGPHLPGQGGSSLPCSLSALPRPAHSGLAGFMAGDHLHCRARCITAKSKTQKPKEEAARSSRTSWWVSATASCLIEGAISFKATGATPVFQAGKLSSRRDIRSRRS